MKGIHVFFIFLLLTTIVLEVLLVANIKDTEQGAVLIKQDSPNGEYIYFDSKNDSIVYYGKDPEHLDRINKAEVQLGN